MLTAEGTALILSKRQTVLQSALAEAVVRQDYETLFMLALKAKGAAERLAEEEQRNNAHGGTGGSGQATLEMAPQAQADPRPGRPRAD